jgi:hypothetical protein
MIAHFSAVTEGKGRLTPVNRQRMILLDDNASKILSFRTSCSWDLIESSFSCGVSSRAMMRMRAIDEVRSNEFGVRRLVSEVKTCLTDSPVNLDQSSLSQGGRQHHQASTVSVSAH